MSPTNLISEAELAVLKVLWDMEQATVRELREQLKSQGTSWAHTTISTLLTRMEHKNLVERDPTGFAHVYSAVASRQNIVKQRLADLADEFCDGASAPLMLALVENQRFTKEEISQFRDLVKQLEKDSQRQKRRPKKRG